METPSDTRGPLRLVVPPEDGGQRVDIYLAAATGRSRRWARRLLGAGSVWRNRQPLRVLSRRLAEADVLDLLVPPSEVELAPGREERELPILFEDQWMAAVDKPAGMLSQPAEQGEEWSADQLIRRALARREGRCPHLHLVHRLDRRTSGVLLFALRPQIQGALARLWRNQRVERRYLALVGGRPSFDEVQLTASIARDRSHRWRFETHADGKTARTEVRVLERREETSLVECRLLSGRTHQVRVHLSEAGYPVVGDVLYGGTPAPRLLLHAWRLELEHPRSTERMRLEAPPPSGLARSA